MLGLAIPAARAPGSQRSANALCGVRDDMET